MGLNRQKTLAILNREPVGTPPLDAPSVHPDVITSAGETIEGFQRRLAELGVRPVFAEARLEKYLAANPWDIHHSDIDYSRYHAHMDPPGSERDHFNFMGTINGPGTPTFYTGQMRFPLDWDISPEDIERYPWFQAERRAMADWDAEAYGQWARQRKADDQVVLGRVGHPFEWSWFIRGFETLMIDLATENELGRLLLGKVAQRCCDYARLFAANGAEGIYIADDLATQQGLFMSIEMFRRHIRPMYEKFLAAAREIKPDIHFVIHCCGNCLELIPDYLELGLDLLNPVQPEAMNVAEVYEKYRGRLSFWRALGVQTTMAAGSVRDVRRETRALIEMARDKGGLIIGPAHSIEPGTPLENVYAYVETAAEYVDQP